MKYAELIIIALLGANIFLVLFYHSWNGKKKDYTEQEGVNFCGITISTSDFMSIMNTLAMYLMVNKEVDLADFLDAKICGKMTNDEIHLIEKSINEYPIVACYYTTNMKFRIDIFKTEEKIAKYQRSTQKDDYIIPFFDTAVIMKYSDLFNISTKYQQVSTMKKIVEKSHTMFNESATILNNIDMIEEDDYVVKRRPNQLTFK